jgi:hypothetical protein
MISAVMLRMCGNKRLDHEILRRMAHASDWNSVDMRCEFPKVELAGRIEGNARMCTTGEACRNLLTFTWRACRAVALITRLSGADIRHRAHMTASLCSRSQCK